MQQPPGAAGNTYLARCPSGQGRLRLALLVCAPTLPHERRYPPRRGSTGSAQESLASAPPASSRRRPRDPYRPVAHPAHPAGQRAASSRPRPGPGYSARPWPVRRLERRRHSGQHPGGPARGPTRRRPGPGRGAVRASLCRLRRRSWQCPGPGALVRTAGVAIGCMETAEHAAVAALVPAELRGSAAIDRYPPPHLASASRPTDRLDRCRRMAMLITTTPGSRAAP
jgi:hypothetical protein